jgi:hypothetical protein
MKNIQLTLAAIIATLMLSTSAFAGMGLGVTGSLVNVHANGEELEGGVANQINTKATASNQTYTGSLFAEYTWDNGFTFGVDYIPGSADVNSKRITRQDIELSKEGTNPAVPGNVDRSAQAEVENHLTYYAELPIHGGLYVKAGYVTLDVNTTEVSGATKYGNTDTDGMLLGFGFKNETSGNWYYKVEATHTEFDTITLTGTGHTAGSAAANKVKADLDVTKATFALGYAF